ncbi:hypothetical protein EYW49_22535 [Siculibacillus lacustris]|uniref:Uncharacterized protein n=1 Tax=Siculibacillus lacustris TaxID=1549641 RepID=A0A4Q9VCG1_9HYPH|nr:hypothetical protein [Siculibacillus lacustris]TBW32161.1 hypothetical protein EYW49_22535 [Siculibacillus lacustris]
MRGSFFGSSVGLALIVGAALGAVWTEPSVAQPAPSALRAPRSDVVVRGWLADLKASGVAVETASIDYDAAGNTARVRGLKIVAPGPAPVAGQPPTSGGQLAIASLDVTDAQSDKSTFSAKTLAATGVKLEAGGVAGSIATLRLDDAVLPQIDQSRFDPGKPFTSLVARLGDLARTSIGSVALGPVEISASGSPSLWKAAIAGLETKGLTAGRVAQLKVGRITVTRDESRASTEIAGVTLGEFDLTALTRIFEARSYISGATNRPWAVFAKSLEIGATSSRDASGVVRFEAVTAGPVRLRPFSRNLTPILDATSQDPQYFVTHKDEARAFADALADFAVIDAVELRRLIADDGTTEPKRQFAFETLTLDTVDPRSLNEARLSGVSLKDVDTAASLETLAIGRLRLVPPPASEAQDGPRGLVPIFGSIELGGLHVLKSNLDLSLAKARIETSEPIGVVPTRSKVNVEGLTLPVAALTNPQLRGFLTDLGQDKVTIGLEIAANWQDGPDEVTLETLSLAFEKLGRLTLSGSLVNVPRSLFERPETIGTVYQQAGLKRFKLGYRDEGLAPRALNLIAAVNKQPPEAIKKALTANMPSIMAPIPDAAARNQMIFAAIGFLNDPQTLDLTATVVAPIPLTTLVAAAAGAPQALPGLLKLDIGANRKR